mgnify:CR=1 FL=1
MPRNSVIDSSLFRHIGFDSSAITRLVQIVHPLTETGRRRLVSTRGGQPAGQVDFEVVDDSTAPASITVDLAAAGAQSADACGALPCVRAGGHLVVHVGSGIDAWGAELSAGGKRPEWSTAELQPGDLVSATLMRPGSYRLQHAEASATVTVTYPKVLERPYRPEPPVHVRSSANSFAPARIRLGPAGTLVVELRDGGPLSLRLVEPDDRPPPAITRPDVSEPSGAD